MLHLLWEKQWLQLAPAIDRRSQLITCPSGPHLQDTFNHVGIHIYIHKTYVNIKLPVTVYVSLTRCALYHCWPKSHTNSALTPAVLLDFKQRDGPSY